MHRLKLLVLLGALSLSVLAVTAQDSGIPTRVYEALDALNAKLGLQLNFEDLGTWRWSEEVYETTAMGCATYPNPETRTTTGYYIRFYYNETAYVYFYPREDALFFCEPLVPVDAPPVDAPPPTPNPFANCSTAPRLAAGGGAFVRDDDGKRLPNALREAPSPDARLLAEIPALATVTVLDGPNCDTAYTYWHVSYNGLTGWTPEGTDGRYFLTATGAPTQPDASGCVIEPQLSTGLDGRVLKSRSDAVNLRALPDPNSDKLGTMAPGDVFRTLIGPICQAEYNYWQVEFQGIVAWAAEGTVDEGYYLEATGRLVEYAGLRFIVPRTLAAYERGQYASATPEGTAELPDTILLPEHVHFTLYDSANSVTGEIRVFRASDYEAYYPGSITTLDSILAQRSSAAITDIGQTHLYITDAANTFRTGENFLTMLDGGVMWRMVAGYAQKIEPQTSALRYVALGLSAEKRYFIQMSLTTGVSLFPAEITPENSGLPADPTAPEWQTFISNYATYLQTEVIPALESAAPEAFAPSLEELDSVTGSMSIDLTLLPPQVFAQSCDTFLTRLVSGNQGKVEPGDANNVRTEPNRNAEKIGQIEPGASFQVIEGPVCDGTMAWWKVEYNGLTGWTVEGDGNDYWVAPVGRAALMPLQPAPVFTPPSLAGLTAGQSETVPTATATAPTVTSTPDITPTAEIGFVIVPTATSTPIVCTGFLPSRLMGGRSARVLPGDANNVRSAARSDADLVGQIPGGEELSVSEGPVCANNGAWWYVHYQGISGWTLEGQGDEYWLEPAGR